MGSVSVYYLFRCSRSSLSSLTIVAFIESFIVSSESLATQGYSYNEYYKGNVSLAYISTWRRAAVRAV